VNRGVKRAVFAVLAAAAAVALAGCRKDRIERVRDSSDSTDYGLADLTAAVGVLAKTPESPDAYRAFHLAVETLRPRFNQTVADIAERQAVFLALGPLAKHAHESPLRQMETLATTVWPAALHVEPTASETVWRYAERVCGKQLATECKHTLPEYWPHVLGSLVWRRLLSRAREAYAHCRPCQADESYRVAMERFEEMSLRASTQWSDVRKRSSPEAWPRAGTSAAAWEGALVLSLDLSGNARIDDVPAPEEGWREAIRARRGSGRVLGLHLRAGDHVRTLRGVLRAATAAGYPEVSLLARDATYPFARREYRLAASGGRGPRVVARDEDTIQVLIRALEVAAASAPGEGRVVLRL
jgi:hypothetical protein